MTNTKLTNRILPMRIKPILTSTLTVHIIPACTGTAPLLILCVSLVSTSALATMAANSSYSKKFMRSKMHGETERMLSVTGGGLVLCTMWDRVNVRCQYWNAGICPVGVVSS